MSTKKITRTTRRHHHTFTTCAVAWTLFFTIASLTHTVHADATCNAACACTTLVDGYCFDQGPCGNKPCTGGVGCPDGPPSNFQVHTYICIYIYIYIYIYTYTYVHTGKPEQRLPDTCICTSMHTYTHIHVHTYTQGNQSECY